MGRGAYSSSNNVWSAKRAAYRRISCKILMNVSGVLQFVGFSLFVWVCSFGFVFGGFFMYFFMAVYASCYLIWSGRTYYTQEVLPLALVSSTYSKTHFGNK